MSLSRSLAQGRDHEQRARTHVGRAREYEHQAWHEHEIEARTTTMLDWTHAARLEWAMAVCALLAWVRYGEGER